MVDASGAAVGPAPSYAAPQVPPAAANVPTPAIKMYGLSIPVGRSPIKIIGATILIGILAVGGWYLKDRFLPKKGVVSYGSRGVDRSKPLADVLYKALAKDATRWKRDATFWSLNFHAVRMDGTVDISQPTNVEYVSPSNSASSLKKTRASSLRKYTAGSGGMRARAWGWNSPVRDIEPHRTPACSIKQLLAKLSAEGVIKTPTVRVTFDPKFADFYAWTLFIAGEDKPKSYSWENCELIR